MLLTGKGRLGEISGAIGEDAGSGHKNGLVEILIQSR